MAASFTSMVPNLGFVFCNSPVSKPKPIGALVQDTEKIIDEGQRTRVRAFLGRIDLRVDFIKSSVIEMK